MNTPAAAPRCGAILLAGGRASRVDGAKKPLFDIEGTTLLERAVTAAQSLGSAPITVVAPVLDDTLPVLWVREDPPFSGPAAAIVTALDAWLGADPEWVLLLACDLPGAENAAQTLWADAQLLPHDTDGICLADESGRPQWLTGLYRTQALRRGAASVPDAGRDAAVRALMDDLAIAVVADAHGAARDIDTWEDLNDARRAAQKAADRTENTDG